MNETKADVSSPPPLEERLKTYGLSSHQIHFENLALGEEESIHLDPSGGRFSKSTRRIRFKTIGELKKLIGVPDSVVQRHCRCRFEPNLAESVPVGFKSMNDLSASQRATLQLAAKEFVHGNSESVIQYEPALNLAISLAERASIIVLLFQDIIVERYATLTLNPGVDVLFANRIIVKLGGKIRALGKFVKYDCVSAEGEEFPYIPIVNPVFAGATLARN